MEECRKQLTKVTLNEAWEMELSNKFVRWVTHPHTHTWRQLQVP